MKYFIRTNWYKLIVSFSFFILSLSIMIFALSGNKAYAGDRTELKNPQEIDHPVFMVASNGFAYFMVYNTLYKKYEAKEQVFLSR